MIYSNFDLNLLKIFVVVFENNGINSASKKLFISQPAVSYAIKKLETTLKTQLFKRLSRGIVPTKEGEMFYVQTKNALDEIARGIMTVSSSQKLVGTLKIGGETSILKSVIIPKLLQFTRQNPSVNFVFTEVISSRLARYLDRGDVDIAFVEAPFKDLKNCKAFPVKKLNYCFVSKLNVIVTKENFENFTWAVLKKNTASRELFDKLTKQYIFNPKIKYEMATYELLNSVCEKDNVVGFCVEQLAHSSLNILQTEIKMPSFQLLGIVPVEQASSLVCQKFCNLFK